MNSKNQNIKQRVIQLSDLQKVSKKEFFQKIGLKYNNFTGKAQESDLGSKAIQQILDTFPELNPRWLISGEGAMFKSTTLENAEPNDLNEGYAVNDQATAYKKGQLIPLFDGVAVGGTKFIADDSAQSHASGFLDSRIILKNATSAMRVYEDSMSPEYKSGEIVVLREVQDKSLIAYGEDYVVETSEYRILKRLKSSDKEGYISCHSINESIQQSSGKLQFPPFDVPMEAVIRLHRVIGCFNLRDVVV